VTVDHSGNLVITDQGNSRIRVVADSTGAFYGQLMAAGDIYTVAGTGTRGYSGDGGAATEAELDLPTDLVVDSHGNLVIADEGSNRVRVVAEATGTFYGVPMTAGDIYTVAGDGNPGFSGDGGPATKAELISPSGVVLAGNGDLYVADAYRVRLVTG
jgi:sugar lactone lactonase YvrE